MSVGLFNLCAVAILDSDGERLAVKYPRRSGASTSSSTGSSSSSSRHSGGGAAEQSRGGEDQTRKGRKRDTGGMDDFASQRQLEQQLVQRFSKLTSRNEVEAFEVGGEYVGLGRSINDVLVFLVSESSGCNEILLLEIYNTLSSALTTLTGGQIGKKQILDNLDGVFLLLDELFDNGFLLHLDPGVILARINMQDDDTAAATGAGGAGGVGGEVASTQTAFNQAISSAKENLIRSLLSGGP